MRFPERAAAVVTGGGCGLGRALSLELGRRGVRVVIADLDPAGAEETATQLRAAGGEAVTCRCDVASYGDVEAAVELAEKNFGRIDIMINNAGVGCGGAVGSVPIADWEWIIGVNLMGVVHGCHAVMPRFLATGSGFILNVASAAGLVSSKEMAPYNVTKAGVVALSETLMQEGVGSGVTVSVLCPTFFKTRIVESGRLYGESQLKGIAT